MIFILINLPISLISDSLAVVMNVGSDGGPSPTRLVANTVTEMFVELTHGDDVTSNTCWQTCSLKLQDKARIIDDPQMLLDKASE